MQEMVKKIVTQQKKSRDSNTEPFVQRKLCADTMKKMSVLFTTEKYQCYITQMRTKRNNFRRFA